MNCRIRSLYDKTFILLLLCTCLCSAVHAEKDKSFAIYLVRHAEKQSQKPQDLTVCGVRRAEDFISVFKSVDINAVYSTDYLRSINTARPIAKQLQLEVGFYDVGKLDDFSKQLLRQQKNTVVVGHLNTTPMLTGLLSGENYKMIKGDDYSRIYQVVVVDGKTHVSILHQSFKCVEPDTSQ